MTVLAGGSDLLDFLPLFPEETETTVWARWCAWANEGLTPDDADEWTDCREGGHFFTWARPGVREVTRVYDLMGTDFVAATMPVWSWGQYLDSIAAGYVVDRLEETQADGRVTFFGPKGLEIGAGAHVGAEQANEEEAAKEYEVTESGTIADPLGAPGSLETTTESTGGGLADGSHYYAVTTVNAEGESIPSAVKKVTLAVGGDGIVILSWGAVAGATAYRVYHATAEGGILSRIAEVMATSYKDDGSPAPDTTTHPPAEDETGDRITLPVEAAEAGVAFNANAGEITVQLSEIGATSIVNREAIVGGTDAQTDEGLLARLLARFEGIGPGNVRAYKFWAGSYPGVGRVVVVPLWDGPNTVLIIALTDTGDPVSSDVVEGLQTFLDPVAGKSEGQSPIGHEVTVTTAEAVTIDVAAEVEFEPGYSLDGAAGTVAMRDDIEAAVKDYIESAEPGGEEVREKVSARIVSFTGLHDVAGVKLNGAAENVPLESEPAQVGELGTLTLVEAEV